MTKLYQLCATILWVSTIVIWQPVLCYGPNYQSESDAAEYLEHANRVIALWKNQIAHAEWNWNTNMTNENAEEKNTIIAEFDKFLYEMHEETIKYPWTTYKDPNIKRQFELFSELGKAALPEEKFEKLHKTVSAMKNVFETTTYPKFRKRQSNSTFEPNTTDTLAASYDDEEYKRVWTQWADSSGKKVKHFYPEYVKLANEAARLHNHTDTADIWIKKYGYEVNDFRARTEHIMKQIKPLVLQIHAFARRKLWEKYGSSVMSRRGPIPIHLVRDLDLDFILPYPKTTDDIDPTSAMIRQNYSATKIYKVAEEFFTSLNFSAMPQSFWEKSVLEKPSGGNMSCYAWPWDFSDSKDYRVLGCASITFYDLLNAHYEMDFMQYYIQYKDQPYIYRDGANDGFSDAIGYAISLSARTPKHLHKIGLSPKSKRTFTDDINYLYNLGLETVSNLPYNYLISLWRWNVFEGITTENDYNCDWWDLRYTYQGLEPPVTRSENDFDPGTKYSIIGNLPHIKYFVSGIIKFQFHQALCEKAGQFDPNDTKSKPLHECDIYQSTNAGNALKEMMRLGSSKPWFDAMELLTGQREMDAGPLLNYFKPLYEWLEKENRRTGELIGWESNKTMCIRAAGARSG